MKKKIVISRKNVPLRTSVWSYFFMVTCFHYWGAPMYVVIGVPVLIFVLSLIYAMEETEIDIFDGISDETDEKKKYQSKFQERLRKMAEERGIKTDK